MKFTTLALNMYVKNTFKIGDIFLYAAILILVVAVFFAFSSDGSVVRVVQKGNTLYTLDLSDNSLEGKTFAVDGAYHNIIKVENGKVFIKQSDCPDKVCLHSTPLDSNGGVICCVPNGLVITVQNEQRLDVIIA